MHMYDYSQLYEMEAYDLKLQNLLCGRDPVPTNRCTTHKVLLILFCKL